MFNLVILYWEFINSIAASESTHHTRKTSGSERLQFTSFLLRKSKMSHQTCNDKQSNKNHHSNTAESAAFSRNNNTWIKLTENNHWSMLRTTLSDAATALMQSEEVTTLKIRLSVNTNHSESWNQIDFSYTKKSVKEDSEEKNAVKSQRRITDHMLTKCNKENECLHRENSLNHTADNWVNSAVSSQLRILQILLNFRLQ